MSRTKLLALILGGLSLGLVLGWLTIRLVAGGFQAGEVALHGTAYQPPRPAGDFTLTAHTGELSSLRDFRDRVVVLYFGYTYCPDICPATLAALANAMNELDQNERERVQVLMISVDPARDTPEALAEYLNHFDPSFLGLSGTDGELAAVTEPLGIFYQKREGTVDSGYLVDHTVSVTVIDKDGDLRLSYPFDTPSADIAADLSYLISE